MISRLRTRFVSVLVLFCLLAIAGFSQTFRGGITGTISDPSGAAAGGTSVQAVNVATGLQRETVTSPAGEFVFQDLPLGEYDVSATHAGFDRLKVGKVQVAVGAVTTLRLTLKVASQSQTVEVAATAINIDTDTSTLNEVIPDKAVQDMPLNGRDFTQLVKLAPGVNGAGSVNGARIAQNNWQIDGADNNDLWHNSAAVNQGGVSGVAGTLLPIDAIDQFSVQSNANAEAGRNGGGSINMVIKSGSNAMHGSLYYFNRNDALAANTPFAPSGAAKPKLKNNQFGGSLGGPVVKDKLFYFLTYERQKLIVGNGTGATEPSAAWVSQATAVLQQYNVALNPAMVNVLSFWPARGRTGPATSPNFFSSDNSLDFSDNGIAKIDYNINQKNNVAVRWFVGTGAQTAPVTSPYHEYYQVAPSRMQNYSLVWNNVISPKLVNQLLLGVNYFKQTFNDFDTGFNPIAAGLNTGVTSPSLLGAPNITINGFDAIGLTPPLGRIDTTGHITETLTYTTGRHQLRFGGEYRRARLDVFYQRNARGTFTFDGSQGPWAGNQAIADNVKNLADYLAGDVQSSSLQVGNMQDNYYMNAGSLFAQDTYKLSKNLTLNFGLRWEYFGPFYDKTHQMSTFIASKGGIVFPGQGIDSLYAPRLNDIAPRFGFAYTPGTSGKLVVRGGYGIFFDSPNLNALGDNRPPNSGATGVIYNPAGPSPIFSTTRSNYTVVPGQPVFGNPALPPPPYGVFSVDQNFKNASLQNFNINTEYQLSNNAAIELGYVGSLGRHLLTVLDINQPPPSTLGASATRASQNVLRPYYSQFPQFATINQVESVANSHYNGMVASLRTNLWHGVVSKFSYTLGHSLDDASIVRGRNPTNSYNLRGDYGNSDFDVRNTFSSYITYNLPTPSRGPKRLVGGWQLNSLMAFHGGQPFTAFSGKNVSGTFEGQDRVDVVGDPFQGVNHSVANGFVQWVNPAAFAQPTPGTFGNEKRNQFYEPGLYDVDFSVFKNTPITERIGTQFRIEMFNIFNHTNLGRLSNTNKLSSGSFGRITDTIGDFNGATGIGAGEPFNVQLALKIIF
jgi:hypothetical protein